jgi:hypothetical protein
VTILSITSTAPPSGARYLYARWPGSLLSMLSVFADFERAMMMKRTKSGPGGGTAARGSCFGGPKLVPSEEDAVRAS